MIEGHGDDAYRYSIPIRADYSSNVLYGELAEGLRTYLAGKIADITHYPEAGAQSLQTVAAAEYGVAADQVLVTNGVTEAIYLLAQFFRGRVGSAFVPAPAFAEYEDACGVHGLEVAPRYGDGAGATGLYFLCNPNNPTGAAMPIEQLLGLLTRNPGTFFVIDESYIEFTRAAKSLLSYLRDYSNVLVLRSLTKSCRIPGIRVGFVIGPAELVRQLRAIKMPWSVNRLAIEAGLYIFSHRQDFSLPVDRLLGDTTVWQEQLKAVTGWKVCDTDTHYFLMETASEFTAAALKQHLVSRYGLLIRDGANFKGLTPHHFRLACQSPEHNQLLTEALCECARTGL